MNTNTLRNMLAATVALFISMFALPAMAQDENEAYVLESADGKTLTFYYDKFKADRATEGTVYAFKDIEVEGSMPWAGTYDSPNTTVTRVVFDDSFELCRPTNTSRWFEYLTALTEINGMEKNLDTRLVTNMNTMFEGCSKLTSLDVSNFNTEKVTDMNNMFYGCSELTSLDVSNFNTENVTDMSFMFSRCYALTSLDISNFNTVNVTNMILMFSGCSALTSLDLSNFNTENVTNMNAMFNGCSALTSLDISNFNTTNVTNMRNMFYACSALTSLDISNFNTTNVTNMNYMFCGCFALTSLDISNFNTTNVTNMNGMFYGCSALATIYCNDDWQREGLASDKMFKGCKKLKGAVEYDANATDAAMANPTTGYFTKIDISAVENVNAEDVSPNKQGIYNLQGMRLNQSWETLQKGLYIVNGKKRMKE